MLRYGDALEALEKINVLSTLIENVVELSTNFYCRVFLKGFTYFCSTEYTLVEAAPGVQDNIELQYTLIVN